MDGTVKMKKSIQKIDEKKYGDFAVTDETDLYLKVLAQIQNGIAARADLVCRVVCGIPVYYKGGGKV